MRGWIDRYRGGEYRQVWAEMTNLVGDLRADPEGLEEAGAVTRETMPARDILRLAFGMVGTRGWHKESAPAPPLDRAFPDEAPPQWLHDVSDQLLPL